MCVELKDVVERLHRAHHCGQDFVLQETSYADVYAMAANFAARFKELEDPSLPVCLAAENRGVIAAALLAAFATGTVLAMPHSFSAMALQQMQEVTGYTAAIVDGQIELAASVSSLFPTTAGEGEELNFADSSLDADLLTLFTGGSTGAPKVWLKTASNIFTEAIFMAEQYAIRREDIVAATISPYHIYGLLFSVLIPLVASATVVAATPLFPAEIAERVEEDSVTIFVSVPAHYRALASRRLAPSLRLAFSSAGMLAEEDGKAFYDHNSVPVVEVYGSTETGGLATRNRSQGEKDFTPLGPVQWQIKEGRLFVQSPFISPDVPVNKDHFFLSSDKVKQCGASSFSLHGRADAITKVGGERVDLDEIRDVLQQQAGVKDCVVLSLPDTSGRGNRIAALVQGNDINITQIKKELPALLETAAFPRIIQEVAEIPTGANGKYDRKAICRLLS